MSIAHGGETVVLTPSKPSSLLAALLLHPGAVVSTDYLLRALWDEGPPATARGALQTCVLRLRRLFAKYGISAAAIEAVPGGYRMSVDDETLDLLKFRDLAAEAASDPDAELYRLKEALALWRGPLLANVASRMLHQDVVPWLEQQRLRALERVCDLELRAGHCHQVVLDLHESVRRHPERERFAEQLIEALYRTGRQAEALAEYRSVKERLREDLGIDPGQRLQRLELAILRSEEIAPERAGEPGPTLVSPAPPLRALSSGSAEPTSRDRDALPLPRLPPVPGFTGRGADRAALAARLTGRGDARGNLVVISGAPGIGKTALALQTASDVQGAFPGGVRVVPLCHPDGTALSAEEAMEQIPSVLPGAGRRLLILDGAAGLWQLRPLLQHAKAPHVTGDGAVVVTSRRALAALVATEGGAVHRLGVLPAAEAHALLGQLVGAERIEAEPEAARQLASSCGYFPLALRIAAGRLLTRPALSLADCVTWLGVEPPARLVLPEDPLLSVPEVFGRALAALDPELREAYVHVGRSTAGEEVHADALVDEATLERLVECGLLEDGPPGPYRIHNFLKVYARWCSPCVEPAPASPC
ncbi:BTAD domain-containing putative transcriptional regulator [Streptomyces sp. NPDC006879]|uniref:AfsR/SARP family transcriptional regulator n=1 Tax=Streptomyces sp. NPDC006879 TaxID=3364767 RepID=UPI0036B9A8CE